MAGPPVGPDDLVLCADEKPGIQARRHRVEPPRPGRLGRVESDYQRCGALQYLCAWDVQRGLPWGRCEPKNSIAAFDRLVEQVMTQDPTVPPVASSGSSTAAPHIAVGRPSTGSRSSTQSHPGAHSSPRVLAQPARDLLRARPAQGADPGRRPRPRPTGASHPRLRSALTRTGPPFRLALHPC